MQIKRNDDRTAHLILVFILAAALVLRLQAITFGLPSLYDPDEPFFMITGLKLLKDHTLDPGWFGHPGTTTIYMLAIIEASVVGLGILTGRFADVHAFGKMLYSDPGMVFIPARLFIVACGVACVFLTFLIGRRLFGKRVGLTAAALLAINPLHIIFSQIIRTDVHATVFMLLCTLFSIEIARRGRFRDYAIAAIWVGLSCATKWPAALIFACVVGACLVRCREHPGETGGQLRYLAFAMAIAVASLFAVSPYLLFDHAMVIANLGGEAQSQHLGATGGTFLWNVSWYLVHPVGASIGWLGLALAAVGAIWIALRSRIASGIVLLGMLAFLVGVSAQGLIWARWIVPLLPFFSLLVAVGLWRAVDGLRGHFGSRPALAFGVLALCGLALPMLLTARADAQERRHDTRAEASAWARANIPAGSTVLVEYLAFDLLPQKWTFLFPAGQLGCIDGNKALTGQIRSTTVGDWRKGRAIIDIGTIHPTKLDSCRANYVILTDYDRYRTERSRFAPEVAVYDRFLKIGVAQRNFAPIPGAIGGPIVRIVKLDLARPL